jgi:hypothetical protein
MTISNNYTQTDIYDLELGRIVNTVILEKDMGRMPFTDVHIISSSRENFTYVVMSNKELKVYENHKVIQSKKSEY